MPKAWCCFGNTFREVHQLNVEPCGALLRIRRNPFRVDRYINEYRTPYFLVASTGRPRRRGQRADTSWHVDDLIVHHRFDVVGHRILYEGFRAGPLTETSPMSGYVERARLIADTRGVRSQTIVAHGQLPAAKFNDLAAPCQVIFVKRCLLQ